ncbi:MAG: COG4223 family protein [Allorhizobium sp.]
MVSEKPPRRSKPANEPVTIDLKPEADTAPPTSQEVRDTDATAFEETAHVHNEYEAVFGEPGASEPVDAAKDQSAPDPFGQSGENVSGPVDDASAASRKPSSAMPALLVAGIVGGLVALSAGGAMQYAGVLPGLSPPAAVSDSNTALAADVAALKTQLAQLSTTAPADSGVEQRLAALETSVKEAAGSSAAVDNAVLEQMQADLTQANTTIAALKSDIAGNAQSLSDSESRITDRLTEAEKKIDAPRDDVEVARAIAVTALKSAVDRGGPFMTELQTLADIAPDDASIADLRPYAAAGVTTRAELVREFPETADAILAAIHQPDPGQGIAGRLMSSALSVIKVRQVGNVEGETPEAITARMEDKLRNGDLKGADLEWNNLPDAGKSVSSAFEKALQARIQVEDLVGSALARSLAANQG